MESAEHVIDGRYKILRTLGQGGFGQVYLCLDSQLHRQVAVKVLQTSDLSDIRRFKQEAQLLSSLNHPNIVRVFALGLDASNRPYFAMDYLQGCPLSQLGVKLSPTQYQQTFAQLLSALAHIHGHGVLHRDIKPANIMMVRAAEDTLPVFIDFGISKAQQQLRATATSGLVGTPAYMSPEQCKGEPLDARSDLYSLGCVMFEVATGGALYSGQPMQIMMQHIAGTNREFPEELSGFFEKLLAADKQNRFGSADEAREALLLLPLDRLATFSQCKPARTALASQVTWKKPLVIASASCLLAFLAVQVFAVSTAQNAPKKPGLEKAMIQNRLQKTLNDALKSKDWDRATEVMTRLDSMASNVEHRAMLRTGIAEEFAKAKMFERAARFAGEAAYLAKGNNYELCLRNELTRFKCLWELKKFSPALKDEVITILGEAHRAKDQETATLICWFAADLALSQRDIPFAKQMFAQIMQRVRTVHDPLTRWGILSFYKQFPQSQPISQKELQAVMLESIETLLTAAEQGHPMETHMMKESVVGLIDSGVRPKDAARFAARLEKLPATGKDRVTYLDNAAKLFFVANQQDKTKALLLEAIKYAEKNEPAPQIEGATAAHDYILLLHPDLQTCIRLNEIAYRFCENSGGSTVNSLGTAAYSLGELYAKQKRWNDSTACYLKAAECCSRYARFLTEQKHDDRQAKLALDNGRVTLRRAAQSASQAGDAKLLETVAMKIRDYDKEGGR